MKIKIIKYINRILYFFSLVLLIAGCINSELDRPNIDSNNNSLPRITIDFGPSFSTINSNSSIITRADIDASSGATQRIATDRELELKNVTLFVFTNNTFEMEGANIVSSPDTSGHLLLYANMNPTGTPNDEINENLTIQRFYTAEVPEINSPVTAIGVANLPPDMIQKINDSLDSGKAMTYGEFIKATILPIDTEVVAGRTKASSTNLILENKIDNSGILPISVDPIQLPALTEVYTGNYPVSVFGYSRIDILLYSEPDQDGSTQNSPFGNPNARTEVELMEAYLSNVPNTPIYTSLPPKGVTYIDYTNPITPATNLATEETNTYHKYWFDTNNDGVAEEFQFQPDDLIQGLYMYPNVSVKGTTEAPYVYIIVKAKTAQSEVFINADGEEEKIPEFFKVLIKYGDDPNNPSFAINRNTRYRLKLLRFEGNGYSSLEEALDNPPSNILYDIDIDSGTGNEFVVTNGTSYMALSNTIVDIYADKEKIIKQNFDGFTIHYEHNEKASSGFADDVWNSVVKRVISETDGLNVVNTAEFSETFQENQKDTLIFMLDNNFFVDANKPDPTKDVWVGEVSIRVGNLLSRVKVNFNQFGDSETQITNYETSDYTYAYIDYGDKITTDLATWIQFGGTTDLEYTAEQNSGIPISLVELTTGYRDNFKSPAYVYNNNGESVRIYILQENLDIVDFSDKAIVNYYIGGSFSDNSELELSNTYMLRPAQSVARKYYIPISSRIKEVWGTRITGGKSPFTKYAYISDSEALAHSDYYDTDGNFVLPEDWDIEIVWYDSQRVYNGNFKFQRDLPNPSTGEERISVTIPANSENYGVVLVSVVDGKGNSLWSWTFWITDYDPMGIARDNLGNNFGAGTYTTTGTGTEAGVSPGVYHSATSGIITEDALHRYLGSVWNSGGLNDGRFMMDRNIGAFDNTAIGHGTVYDNNNEICISDPLSGSLTFQHANPRPYPAKGAIKGDGTRLENITPYSTPASEGYYTTVIGALRVPYNFCVGLPGSSAFSHWLNPANNPAAARNIIWGDVSLKLTNLTDVFTTAAGQEVVRVTKSIFDPSPLGWMVPNKFTYFDFAGKMTADNALHKYSTLESYLKFARFFYVTYRSSSTGTLVRVKDVSNSETADGYMRTNETYFSSSHNNTWRDDYSLALGYVFSGNTRMLSSGKASGCSIRPITQATYK